MREPRRVQGRQTWAGRLSTAACVWASLAVGLLTQERALAQEPAPSGGPEETPHYPLLLPPFQPWSFSGVFGKFDREQLRRGLEVYQKVCANCHGLSEVAIRTLADKGGPELPAADVAAIAAGLTVSDVDDLGHPIKRPGRLYDRFPTPDIDPATFNGAKPPDLSIMAKARDPERGFPYFLLDAIETYQEGGPDYIYALLTGYRDDPPANVTIPPGTFYNPYFAAAASLAMPPPLSDGAVHYADGTPETLSNYARDVAAFLMWTAEPHLVERKSLGFEVLAFLVVFATLMYFSKRRIWARVHHEPAE